jgi:F-type H+-transporting ATPase subunit O
MQPAIRLFTSCRILTASLRNVPLHPILRFSFLCGANQLQPLPFTRFYAAAAAPSKGIKPPITIHTLEGTYASALFSSAAANSSTLNEIERSLATIRQRLDRDAKLSSVVVNPALSHKEKLDVIKLLTQFGGGGGEASKAVHNLLEVMSENGRLRHLDGVVSAFARIMRAHKGEVDVVVTSAQVRPSTLPCTHSC